MAIRSRADQIAGVAYTFLVMSTIATLLRIYCRAWVIKAFSLDDWLAVGAQILFIVFTSYELTGVSYGTGRHVADIDPEHLPKAMQMWWTCEPLYVLTNMFIKASIALFLLRICVDRVHKIIIWTVTGITEIYSLFFFLLFILQCRPTSLFWLRVTENPPSGSCLDAKVVSDAFYGYSAISCLTDWTYSILPMFVVWNLQMDRKVKLSVVLILAAGTIASAATIVRFPYLYSLTDINDFLYSTSDVAIWSTVETGLGITAAGFATLRPLLRRFFGGSSAHDTPGDPSAGPWHRTGSGHPSDAYGRGLSSRKGQEGYELRDNNPSGKDYGVTTVIRHGEQFADVDTESQKNTGLDDLDSDPHEWSGSDQDLTNMEQKRRAGQAWNITVEKSVVQTRN
ncbi:uncharacterized protein F5Z01DRAFT_654303 [Emericellopsis atlantica]|uniref:Rhodopsin domain-containing protein n=1 Tax=Emericellopsis atlantica TaxID=2614577 RepID=A0A9P7ZN83_9HYPO|nr:uncharacterized protein F5Z01DRAFT_654303 [Emericellopsis atlantica]KAG9254598.1 hypothetical protein F5Z01DRAFT_654303 [Emericellopsis atlantica]